MNLEILLASGETDTLNGVDETIVEDNYLHVLMEIDGDEIPAGMKTLTVTRELSLDEESQLRAGGHQEVKQVPGYLKPHLMTELPRPTKTQTYRLAASYAPGMWMKVMYL
jgi:hypothetical protein